jgi:hypothetical protein
MLFGDCILLDRQETAYCCYLCVCVYISISISISIHRLHHSGLVVRKMEKQFVCIKKKHSFVFFIIKFGNNSLFKYARDLPRDSLGVSDFGS